MVDFYDFLQSTAEKNKIMTTATSKIQYPTGFMFMDYGAGSYLNVYDADERLMFNYHNIGIGKGSVNVIIAKSQGGKTTLAIKMAVAILEPYINQMLYNRVIAHAASTEPNKSDTFEMEGAPFVEILDTEKTLPTDYVKKLAKYTNKLIRKHVIINPITTDQDLIKCLDKHVIYKTRHMKKIRMPMLDMFGKPIYEYPPTVLIIDSTSQLLIEDCDDPNSTKKSSKGIVQIYADSTQNTSGARRAKIISALYSQLVNYADRYNIIIFSINHINKMLPVNGVPVKQYRGLRAGETINGGEKAIFLASSILRLDVIKNVSAESTTSVNLGDDVKGHIAKAAWIKSKSNSLANTSQLVYTNQNGYDQLLSNLWMLKEKGILPIAGRNFYLPKYPDFKFTLKNYQEIFSQHPEMLHELYFMCRDACTELLDNIDNAEKKERQLLNAIREDIHDEYSKSDAMDLDDIFANAITL